MTKWTGRLIVLNFVMAMITWSQPRLYAALALVPATVLREPWTLVTYMFVHGGMSHLLFNLLTLFFFGPKVEARLGSANFLRLYFVSGLGGALLSFLLAPNAAVVGASGAIYGVLLAFAAFWPDERIYLWFVLPIPSRVFVAGLAALSIFFSASGKAPGVAHFAHLGGFLGGWLFLLWHHRHTKTWQRRVNPAAIQRIAVQNRADVERWKAIPLDQLHPINREEVERVLQKLETQGISSLTQDERAFLDRMC